MDGLVDTCFVDFSFVTFDALGARMDRFERCFCHFWSLLLESLFYLLSLEFILSHYYKIDL
jgi:peptidoglycan/LPS O-acetylase OafA/YrhL